MKLFTLCIGVVITTASWAQQMKLEDFYPVTRPYKTTDTKHLVSCINGDCNNGNGTLVLIRSLYSGDNAYAMRRVMTGTFSNNGKNFSGKIYQHFSNYKPTPGIFYTPADTLDFSTQEGLQKALYLEGSFILEADSSYQKKYFSRNYLLHGSGVDYNLLKLNNQYQSVKGEYDSGTVRKVEINYAEGSPIKKFSGWVKMNYELQFGLADYADGSTYIGFFNNNIFDGPGKYTGSKGVLEGVWKEGGLYKNGQTGFTPALLNSPDDKKDVFTYKVDGYTYTGNFYGKLLNGKPDGPAIISGNKSLFYGIFKAGVLQGTSFMKKEFTWNNDYSENIYYGLVKDSAFIEGTRSENQYSGLLHGYWIYAGKELDGIWRWHQTTTGTGSFKEGKLSGCGVRTLVNAPHNSHWDVTTEGRFKNGQPKGWAMVTVPKFSPNNAVSGFRYYEGTYLGDLQSYGPSDYKKLTERSGDLFHLAMTDTSSCVLVPQEEKEKYIAKTKQLIKEKEIAAKLAAITPKDPCKERKIPVGYSFPPGCTVEHKDNRSQKFILQAWDCATDTYFILYKASSDGYASKGIEGSDFRYYYRYSTEQLKYCSACKGLGETSYQIEEVSTKEWEQVNFNVYIKKTPRTVSRWITQKCKVCSATGMLKK